MVNNTAAATLRQLVTHVFEKLVMEDSELGAPAYDNFNANSLNPCGKDAYLLFLDLCKLTNGEDPDFLVKVQNVTKGFGLELIESVLTNHHKLFKSVSGREIGFRRKLTEYNYPPSKHPELLRLLKDRVCPLVIRSFSDKNDFPLTIRLMRVVQIIIIHFHGVLVSPDSSKIHNPYSLIPVLNI